MGTFMYLELPPLRTEILFGGFGYVEFDRGDLFFRIERSNREHGSRDVGSQPRNTSLLYHSSIHSTNRGSDDQRGSTGAMVPVFFGTDALKVGQTV